MHKQVKNSMDALFAHEQLQKRAPKKRTTLRPFFAGVGIVCIVVLLVLTQRYIPTERTSEGGTSIFELKHAAIDEAKALRQIADYVMPTVKMTSMELQTNENRAVEYVTLYTEQDISLAVAMKYAYYVFALLAEPETIVLESANTAWNIERTGLQQMQEIDFATIDDEITLVNAYYRYTQQQFDVPQIQTVAEHMYKVFFNLRAAGELYKRELRDVPTYVFYLNEKPYYLWLEEDVAYYASSEDPLQLYRVTGERLNDMLETLAWEQERTAP